MAELTVDDTSPSGEAYVVESERTNSVGIMHGGITTRFTISSAEQMPISLFLRKMAGKARIDDDEMFVMRDGKHNEAAVFLGDGVTRYKVTDIQEVPTKMFADELVQETGSMITTDLPWPLVALYTEGETTNITILIPSHKRRFRDSDLEFDADIWWPSVWYRATFNSGMFHLSSGVAVVLDTSSHWEDTQLYALPFPNCSSNGHICLGQSTQAAPIVGDLTRAKAMQSAIDRYFNGEFNRDLLSGKNFREITGVEGGTIRTMLNILRQKDGWLKLNYQKLAVDAGQFCRGR